MAEKKSFISKAGTIVKNVVIIVIILGLGALAGQEWTKRQAVKQGSIYQGKVKYSVVKAESEVLKEEIKEKVEKFKEDTE